MKKTVSICLASSLLFSGCMTAAQHQAALGTSEEEQLTVAAVQREIRLGMSGAAVLAVLGSPNIVSTDSERLEVWVYDRVGTEYTYSEGRTGLVSLIGAAGGSAAGGVLPTHEHRAGATRRSQKTLTIIIKFDEDKRVRDFSYHASRF
jgi:outer membrane protein assembly factor BamE (lipoprotein component of BamABCDE complex)